MNERTLAGSASRWGRVDWLNRHDQRLWRLAFGASVVSGFFLANPWFVIGFGFAMSSENEAVAAAATAGFANGGLLYISALGGTFFPRLRPFAVLAYIVHLVLMVLVFSDKTPLA